MIVHSARRWGLRPAHAGRTAVRTGALTVALILTVGFTAALLVYTPQQARAEALNSWTSTTGLPIDTNSIDCVTSGGYVYCLAGGGNAVYYAPLTSSGIGSWTQTTSYPTGISGESCVASGGYIYCVDGITGTRGAMPTSAVYYAPLSSSGVGAWTPTTNYTTPEIDPSCAAASGYVYCVGGYGTVGTLQTSGAYYAPVSSSGVGAWTDTTSYPTALALESCLTSGGYIYCVGGYQALGPQPINSTYYATVSSSGIGNWVQTTNYPFSVWGESCVTSSGYVYCITGNEYNTQPNEVYYASSNPSGGLGPWTSTTNYPIAAVAVCVASGGFMYCVGEGSAYYTSVQSVSATAQLTVNSENTNGQTITGYYTVLYDNQGNVVSTGFTPASFTLNSGQSYMVQADSYGNCNFAHWSDTGSTSATRSITITTDTQLMAVYNCSGTGSSVTVGSVDQNGNAIFGYYTVLYGSGGNVLSTGFTTQTFSTTAGQSYSVLVDNYGSCSFSHWQDTGAPTDPRPFTATSGPLALTAVYNCVTQSSVTVNSVDQHGDPISGYYVVLYGSSGNVLGSGFTTTSFPITAGQHYSIRADGYGSCTFTRWSNGNMMDPMTFVGTSSPMSFTAVYNCGSG